MANTVDKVISIALAEVGYLEKKSNSQLDNKTANAGYNNYTKYGRDMHALYPAVMDFPAAWCDCFVDWCFQKAYGVSNAKKLLCGNFDDYTVNSALLYKKKNQYYTSNPKKGDQIFFKNEKGGICHTGLVYNVSSTHVFTIEGNTSAGTSVVPNGGGVYQKSYLLTNSRIDGYGRPKYDTKESKPKVANIKISNKLPASINIRNKKSYDDTKSKTIAKVKKGETVTVNAVDSKGVWCKVTYEKVTGYTKLAKIKSATATTTSGLNCRQKPDEKAKVICTFKKGTKINVYRKKGEWYLCQRGWVHGSYIK